MVKVAEYTQETKDRDADSAQGEVANVRRV